MAPSETFQELMKRVRAGDEEAAALLVRDYEPALQRVVRVRLFDQRARQVVGESDIVQAVMGSFFVRAALGQYELEGPADLARLLAVIARNKIADEVRKVGRRGGANVPLHELTDDALPSPAASPSRIVYLRQVLTEARAQLPPDILKLVELRDEGLDWAAIARQVGGTPEALRKRHARAIEATANGLGLGSAW